MFETTNQWKLVHNNFPKRWPKGSQILEIHQFEPLPFQRNGMIKEHVVATYLDRFFYPHLLVTVSPQYPNGLVSTIDI